MSETVSAIVIPAVVVIAGFLMFSGKHDYFGHFCDGARSGLATSVKLLPSLCAIMVALRMFTASGAVDILTSALTPVCTKLGIPAEIIPLILTRPVSGAASNGAFATLIESVGADSFPALCAAIIMGSSDTMIYIMAVYFSGAGIRHTRYAIPVAAAVMIFCIFMSCFISRLFFGAGTT